MEFGGAYTMIYRIPVSILPLEQGGFLARCKDLRATALGETPDEAIRNLREAIEEMVEEYGQAAVFQDIDPETRVEVIEVAV